MIHKYHANIVCIVQCSVLYFSVFSIVTSLLLCFLRQTELCILKRALCIVFGRLQYLQMCILGVRLAKNNLRLTRRGNWARPSEHFRLWLIILIIIIIIIINVIVIIITIFNILVMKNMALKYVRQCPDFWRWPNLWMLFLFICISHSLYLWITQ